MINNLDELKLYTEEVATKFPAIASEIKLCSPGCSKEQLATLKQEVPQLPQEYLDIANQVQLVAVSIGQLSLWPVPYGKRDFLLSLIEANTDSSNPYLDFYNSNNLVEVARLEANLICLGKIATENEGQVFLVDISSGENLAIEKLADNFEQLLVLAGNLHQISMFYEEDEDSGVSEFTFRLNRLGLDRDCASIWHGLLEEWK